MCINASFLTTHHYHSLLQVMKNRLPCLTQPRERPCGIGGACGRKHCRFDSSNRKLVPFIKLPCLVSVCINLCHVRFFQNHAGVILVTTVYSGIEYFAKNADVFKEVK